MAKKDLEKTMEQAQQTAAKQELDVSEVFKVNDIKETDLLDFYNKAVANPGEARELLVAEMQKYDGYNKQSSELIKNIAYYTEKLTTGFDIRNAKFFPKAIYKAASAIPIASWKEAAKQKVSDHYKIDLIDNMITAITNLEQLTVNNKKLIETGATSKSKLMDLANGDYLMQQQTAVKKMNETIVKINDYSKTVKELEEKVKQYKGKESEHDKLIYLDSKKLLSESQELLFNSKQDLVKRTIDYNVAEDCYFQTLILTDKFSNTLSAIDIKNYEVNKTTHEITKMMPYKAQLHKLVEAGEGLVTMKNSLVNLLRDQEVSESNKIKYLAQIVASDVQEGVFAPIQGVQIELNEEARKLIEATHAYVISLAKSGVRQKQFETLLEQVKSGETPYKK